MHQKKKKAAYYKIRVELFWGMILCFAALLAVETYRSYQFLEQTKKESFTENGQIRIEMTYDDWSSELTEPDQCFLCGEHAKSRISHYQGIDTIGLISLNDWAVAAFQLNDYDRECDEAEESRDSGILYRNTDEITYISSGDTSRGMAKINVTMPDNYQIDDDFIRQNLCQPCLDKVAASLRFWKWENEEKEAVPLCLIDFQTLEIHPLQDCYRAYFIRDYWVEMDFEENKISVKAYYLPLASTACSASSLPPICPLLWV